MDGEAYSNVEFPSNLPTHPESASYGGSVIFSGSQNFTVAGGLFKSVTNNYTTAATVPPALINEVAFRLNVGTTNDPPLGYLFLCPQIDFQIGPSSFGWSNSPAYWSLDPAGAERLRVEEAIRLSLSF
ncbi:hypothetical protein C8J57DRAFT_1730510 [Mycena rebaudengoi]|nr:hypothetical protein C8J57DRAFT_1730510 [Mycena rebaudengoi]